VASRDIDVLVAGAAGLAEALRASARFARVLAAESTSELKKLIEQGLLGAARPETFVFMFSSTLREDLPGFTVDTLVGRLVASDFRVVILETSPNAREIVRKHPACGLMPGPFSTNVVLAALSGTGIGLLDPLDEAWARTSFDPLDAAGVLAMLAQPEPAQPAQPSGWGEAPAPFQPVEPAQPAGWGTEPAQPAQPSGWGEAPAPVEPFPPVQPSGWGTEPTEPAQPSGWGEAPAPVEPFPPVQPAGWGTAPAEPAQPASPSGWGTEPAEHAQPSGWGSAPGGPAQPVQPAGWGTEPTEPAQPPGWGTAPAEPAQPWGGAAAPAWGATQDQPSGWGASEPSSWGTTPVQDSWGAQPADLSGYTTPGASRKGTVISVTVPKGGAGKSTLVLNWGVWLGLRLRAANRTVCIVDANVQQPDIGKQLNAYTPNIAALARSPQDQDPARIGRHLLHRQDLNTSFLLGPLDNEANPQWITPELYAHAVEALRHLYDYVIVDTAVAEFHHEMFDRFVLPCSDFIIVPVTPDYVTLQNADLWLKNICAPRHQGGKEYPRERIGIVLNMATDGVGLDEAQVRSEFASWNYLGSVPASKVWQQARNADEIVATRNYAEINAAFAQILGTVTGDPAIAAAPQQGPGPKKRGLRDRFKR
jgi:MinD-like ATPase involved in chromosome partitioning or flagellar assembly